MAKCISCNRKIKFSRDCPALGTYICSTCCGTKKLKEIQCPKDCRYLQEHQIKENKKAIEELVKVSFNNLYTEDIYGDPYVVSLVAPMEEHLFYQYYHQQITDDFFFECFTKIYYTIGEENSLYIFNDIEADIRDKFCHTAKQINMPIEQQKYVIIRILKSITNMTGGLFGNKMYLEMLRDTFTQTGLVTEVMKHANK